MQFDPQAPLHRRLLRGALGRERWADKFRFGVLELADLLMNRASPEAPHAVTIDSMVEGRVGAALSALYCPFEEMDLTQHYGSAPLDSYFPTLHHLLEVVEEKVAADPRAVIVRDFDQLDRAIGAEKLAIIHAVEGGLMIGRKDASIERNVATLASKGCSYITVCHLFYREVGTNAPALPFLPDVWYERLFPQHCAGLDARGKTLIRAMLRNGVLIDVTHMSEASMTDTFDLLDAVDPAREVPVIASHIACRIGALQYNLTEPFVRKIADRHGIAGIIYCDHFVRDDPKGPTTKCRKEAFEKLKVQVDQLRSWGGDDIVAIGSDLDGFIKPTLAGLESAADHRHVAEWLVDTYGLPFAKKACHENALRVMRSRWRQPFAV